jgi:hypothetical protein
VNESIIVFLIVCFPLPAWFLLFLCFLGLHLLVFLLLALRLSPLVGVIFNHFDVLQVGLGILLQLLQLIAIHLHLPLLSIFNLFLLLLSFRLFGRFDGRFELLFFLLFDRTSLLRSVLIDGFDVGGDDVLNEEAAIVDLTGVLVMPGEGRKRDFVHIIILVGTIAEWIKT